MKTLHAFGSGKNQRCGLLFIVCVCFVFSSTLWGQEDEAGSGPAMASQSISAPSGKLDFQTDLATGRFNTRIPIVVPPARGNATPNIVLGYNSSGANGWCGVGWSLDMGVIQRDTRDGVPVKFQSDGNPESAYSEDCGFMTTFQGTETRLIPLGDNNYCAEIERAFARFHYVSTGEGAWTVTDKNGTRYFFGSRDEANSRLTTSLGTFRWALDRVADLNGNATYLDYEQDNGQIYLKQIKYNGHEPNGDSNPDSATHFVEFAIRLDRPDTNINYRTGSRVETRGLLTNIVVKVGNDQVRSYRLNYIVSSSTYRSLLAEVQQRGTNDSSVLPSIKFEYQQMDFRFKPPINWGPLITPGIGDANSEWHSIRAINKDGEKTFVEFLDINGDGLPDRVLRHQQGVNDRYVVQLNTGSGFGPITFWTPVLPSGREATAKISNGACSVTLQDPTASTNKWGQIGLSEDSPAHTLMALIDLNGDGLPDRAMRQEKHEYCANGIPTLTPLTNLIVQINTGLGFTSLATWGPLTNALSKTNLVWNGITKGSRVMDLLTLDINGDGLPDRVMWAGNNNSPHYEVQLNTGKGFTGSLLKWGGLNNANPWGWDTIADGKFDRPGRTKTLHSGGDVGTALRLQDINGDGLPDRLMVKKPPGGTGTNIVVQFNTGTGFADQTAWGPVLVGLTGSVVVCTGDNPREPCEVFHTFSSNDYERVIHYSNDGLTKADLIDINGDGLPDRVTSFNEFSGQQSSWYKVQLNTGSGFGPAVRWEGLNSQGNWSKNWMQLRGASSSGTVFVDLIDINGDGLVDRVMRKRGDGAKTNFVVQLNAGPFPDLMNRIDNGIGGSTLITYTNSTVYDNRGTNGIPTLPYPVYVATSVSVADGRGQTNTTMYSYKGGYHSWDTPEFRGFHRVEVIDPLGAKSITYFHQGRQSTQAGARTLDGLFTDEMAKKGMPYRTELWGLVDDVYRKFSQSINVVAVTNIHSSSSGNCYFPFVARTVSYEFEGLTNITPKMTATEFDYDIETGDPLRQSVLGEVVATLDTASINYGAKLGDEVYTHTSYTNFPDLNVTRPVRIWTSSDPAGNNKLRETRFEYDEKSRLTKSLRWINTEDSYATNTINSYDSFGNPTSATDAAGIVTTTEYDSAHHHIFSTKTITAIFTNTATYDLKSGQTLTATDAKGLRTTTVYDEFLRPVENRICTNGESCFWRNRFEYGLGGISNGISGNFVRKITNDGGELLTSTTYFDGLGRGIQTYVKSEISCDTNAYHRVAYVEYDARGKVRFASLPYLRCSDDFQLPDGSVAGSTTHYDAIGRLVRVSPPDGDMDSPTGDSTTAYTDGTNLWITVSTDAEGKTHKSVRDAYGRVRQVIEPGGATTHYHYDLVGNLTNVVDAAGNSTSMTYDSLGRKIAMTDPDMGSWTYAYDVAGRMVRQTDAKNQKLTFFYDDPLGRLTQKSIFNAAGFWQADVTYQYDESDDQDFTVFKGQLYRVTDRQGHQKNSYDIQGRVVRTERYLNINEQAYRIETEYDILDRTRRIIYPDSLATIEYTYDSGGNLKKVESTAGTGANEVFYQVGTFNELGQLTSYTNGNTAVTTYSYYSNSKRFQQMQTISNAGSLQSLSYKYDKVSNIERITDNRYGGQSGDATLTDITYDDLHRLTSYKRSETTFEFEYDPLGNMTKNPEFGGGTYSYPSTGQPRPHAVTNANGKAYFYDASGNMTNRNGQVLIYDEENQLKQVINTNGVTVTFGYSDGGARLWQVTVDGSTTNLTVWIGGIYEEKNGKTLCHVFADGKRVATFEPVTGFAAFIQQRPVLAALDKWLKTATTWPLRDGRAPLTTTLIPLLGVLCASVVSRRFSRRRRSDLPVATLRQYRWYLTHDPIARSPIRRFFFQLINVILIVAVFVAVTPTNVNAQTFDPVFYYYHSDHLGSSNVMTDRDGELVQRYEYTAFGKERFVDNSQAFSVSHRYTGQIFDEATGLYYYNARYYDPQLGRFIQPDSVVPDPSDPQTLNRYSYVLNNPLLYVDPSGNLAWLAPLIIAGLKAAAWGAATGAVVGGIVAGATGGNVMQGIAAGIVGGGLMGFGIGFGGAAWGTPLGSAIGGGLLGAGGGAAGAAINGGDIRTGAIIGGISGFIAGALDPIPGSIEMTTGEGGSVSGEGSLPSGPTFNQGAFIDIPAPTPASVPSVPAPTSAPGLTPEMASAFAGGSLGFGVGLEGAVRFQNKPDLAGNARLGYQPPRGRWQRSFHLDAKGSHFNADFGPLKRFNHAPVSQTALRLGSTTALKAIGRTSVAVGLAVDVARIATTTGVERYGAIGGAIGGAAVGAAGAAIGAFLLPGLGAPIGGFVGGVVGGFAGEYIGSFIGRLRFQ